MQGGLNLLSDCAATPPFSSWELGVLTDLLVHASPKQAGAGAGAQPPTLGGAATLEAPPSLPFVEATMQLQPNMLLPRHTLSLKPSWLPPLPQLQLQAPPQPPPTLHDPPSLFQQPGQELPQLYSLQQRGASASLSQLQHLLQAPLQPSGPPQQQQQQGPALKAVQEAPLEPPEQPSPPAPAGPEHSGREGSGARSRTGGAGGGFPGEVHKERLRWTPLLHSSFVQAVNSLGGAAKAKPREILDKMSVPGLSISHIKSHLQKYRLTGGGGPTSDDSQAVAPSLQPSTDRPSSGLRGQKRPYQEDVSSPLPQHSAVVWQGMLPVASELGAGTVPAVRHSTKGAEPMLWGPSPQHPLQQHPLQAPAEGPTAGAAASYLAKASAVSQQLQLLQQQLAAAGPGLAACSQSPLPRPASREASLSAATTEGRGGGAVGQAQHGSVMLQPREQTPSAPNLLASTSREGNSGQPQTPAHRLLFLSELLRQMRPSPWEPAVAPLPSAAWQLGPQLELPAAARAGAGAGAGDRRQGGGEDAGGNIGAVWHLEQVMVALHSVVGQQLEMASALQADLHRKLQWHIQVEREFEQQLGLHIDSIKHLVNQSLAPLIQNLAMLSGLCARMAGAAPEQQCGAAGAGATAGLAPEHPAPAAPCVEPPPCAAAAAAGAAVAAAAVPAATSQGGPSTAPAKG